MIVWANTTIALGRLLILSLVTCIECIVCNDRLRCMILYMIGVIGLAFLRYWIYVLIDLANKPIFALKSQF